MSEFIGKVSGKDLISKIDLKLNQNAIQLDKISDESMFQSVAQMASSGSFDSSSILDALNAVQKENTPQGKNIKGIVDDNFPRFEKNDWLDTHEDYYNHVLFGQFVGGNISDENFEILKQNLTEEQINLMALMEDTQTQNEDEDNFEHFKDVINKNVALKNYLNQNPDIKFGFYLGLYTSGNMSDKEMIQWVQSTNDKSSSAYLMQILGDELYFECSNAPLIKDKASSKEKKIK